MNPKASNRDVFLPHLSDEQQQRSKDRITRLNRYIAWLDDTSQTWYRPDLPNYLKHLQESSSLSPPSIRNYIAAIRARYRELLHDAHLDMWLRELVSEASASEFITETRKQFEAAIDPSFTRIEAERPKLRYLALTQNDIEKLFKQPGIDSLRGLRDTAMIAVQIYLGLREGEVSALQFSDLRHMQDDDLALHVPAGLGCKERLIPYLEPNVVLPIMETWLKAAGITEGQIFRGFYRNNTSIRATGITSQTVHDMLAGYSLVSGSESIRVRPFDLRRFNARALYASEMDISTIGERLGLNTLEAVLEAVGTLDNSIEGLPPFNLNSLKIWEK